MLLPALTAVTSPVALFTVATEPLLLLHTPPKSELPSVVLLPAQIENVPLIAPGSGLTVTTCVCWQPVVANMYVIAARPAVPPVTTPVGDIDATDASPLIQSPPGVKSYRSVVEPEHTVAVPEIACGSGFTVTLFVTLHVVGSVYVIVALPADRPVAMPLDGSIDSVDELLLVHAPPVGLDV